MIAWQYLDKTAATIAAMRDYGTMKFIIENTDSGINKVRDKMQSPRTSDTSETRASPNSNIQQNFVEESMVRLDAMGERYRQARDYMTWFEPAWRSLSETDRRILQESYMNDNLRSGSTMHLADELSYSESHIKRLRQQALARMQGYLYGR